MCRSIKRLRQADGPAGAVELREAARQYVRKVSGMQRPSAKNAEAFEQAVEEITHATARLLNRLPPLQQRPTPPGVSSMHPAQQTRQTQQEGEAHDDHVPTVRSRPHGSADGA